MYKARSQVGSTKTGVKSDACKRGTARTRDVIQIKIKKQKERFCWRSLFVGKIMSTYLQILVFLV